MYGFHGDVGNVFGLPVGGATEADSLAGTIGLKANVTTRFSITTSVSLLNCQRTLQIKCGHLNTLPYLGGHFKLHFSFISRSEQEHFSVKS